MLTRSRMASPTLHGTEVSRGSKVCFTRQAAQWRNAYAEQQNTMIGVTSDILLQQTLRPI